MTIECDKCGEPAGLHRNNSNQLVVKCDCAARTVKVRQVLPAEWL